MAESGLAMEYADYLTEVARVWGVLPPGVSTASASSFDSRTLASLHAVMDSGLRQFYGSREWTFLEPEARLYTANGVGTYSLPDDFDRMAGPFFYTEMSVHRSVERVTWDELRRLKAHYDQTGYPWAFALSAVAPDSGSGTRRQAEFHPIPTQAWELAYRYRVLQEPLRSTNTRPHGGAAFSEAILSSMLDILEVRAFGEVGAYRQRWIDALAFAARQDSAGDDKNLGYGATEPVASDVRWPRHMSGLVQYQTPSS